MTQIIDIIQNIRDFINSPRMQHLLIADNADWNKLCSSLDVIEDTELAIEAYPNMHPKSDGEIYIVIYGILQMMIVQQDAVKHIAEALNLKYFPNKLLLDIREIRHDSIGHPTKRGSGKGSKFNIIIRNGMSSECFSLMTTFENNEQPKFTHINILDIIEKQKINLTQILSEIITKLKDEEMKHRKIFQAEKLKDIFPDTLSNFCDQISETIDGVMPSSFGVKTVDIINEYLDIFKDALNRRNESENITYLFDLLSYPLKELKNYFTDGSNSTLNDKGAYIFTYFIRKHLSMLRDIAIKIDTNYATDP